MSRRSIAMIAMAISLCFAGSAAQSRDDVDLADLPDEQLDELVEFVIGNAMFILYHEAGHMLVSEFDVPVLGREEDAVDTLSGILMLEGGNEVLDKAIIDAADGWFLSGEATAAADKQEVFWGAHGIDEQRAWSIACLMAGHDYSNFKEFIDSLDFPEDRRAECIAEYPQKVKSWTSLLKPYEVTAPSTTKFTVTYEPVADADLDLYASMIRESKLLEMIGNTFSGLYKLKDGIKLTAKSCGEANAYWSPADREITFCYEFAKFHGQLVANYFMNNNKAEDDGGRSDEAPTAVKHKPEE